MRSFCIVGLVLAASNAASAYTREKTPGSTPVAWFSSGNIQYQIDASVRSGAKNSLDEYTVVPGSDPVAAIQAALDTWNSVGASRARFAPVQAGGSATLGRADFNNVIGFANSAALTSAVGDAIAVTAVYFNTRTGEIVDADIVLNPEYRFASKLAYNAFDLQSVVTHELGHSLGAGHSPLPSATMYAYGGQETTTERTLTADDLAFLVDAYPTNPADPSTAAVKGKITCPAGTCDPVPSVLFFDAGAGNLIQTTGAGTGDYSIPRIPPGTYYVFVEPYLSEDETLNDVSPTWGAGIYGGAQSPQTIDVPAGSTIVTNLTVQAPKLLTMFFSAGDLYSGESIHSGYSTSFQLAAQGRTQTVHPEDVLFFGGGMKLIADSLDSFASDKISGIFFDFDVASAKRRSTAVIAIRQGDAVVLAPGITILPDMPAALPSDVLNAASYDPGPIAPGELISLAGYRLGPPDGIGPGDARAAGIAIQIGGVDAPILYASDGYLRVQVPYEVAGHDSAVLHVQNGDAAAEEILAEVSAASPGIVLPIFNEDGTPNGRRTPAARGSVVTMYGTGQGVIQPSLPTGVKAGSDTKSVIPDVSVEIDGTPAEVKAAYMVPGAIGMFRLDIAIPQGVAGPGPLALRLSIAKIAVDMDGAISIH